MLNYDKAGFELDVAKRLYMLWLFDEWGHCGYGGNHCYEPIEDCLKRNSYIFAPVYEGKHDGDCVKVAATCFLCVREQLLETARKLIANKGDVMGDMVDALELTEPKL